MSLTLSQVEEKVREREAKIKDEVVMLSSLRLDSVAPGTLLIQRGPNKVDEYPIMDHVYGLLGGRLLPELPARYLKRMAETDPRLAAENFNYWVKHQEKDKEVLIRYFDEGMRRIGAVLPGGWTPFPVSELIQTLEGKFGPDHVVKAFRVDHRGIKFDILTGKVEYKPRQVGDEIEWGFRFQDSDFGFRKLDMSPYSFRLVCTNGMVSMRKGVGVSASHTRKNFEDRNLFLQNVLNSLDIIEEHKKTVAEQIRIAQEIELPDDPDHLKAIRNRINKRFYVTRFEDKCAEKGWEEESDLPSNVWRLSNGYTRGANNPEIKSFESKARLQEVGGGILSLAFSGYKFN